MKPIIIQQLISATYFCDKSLVFTGYITYYNFFISDIYEATHILQNNTIEELNSRLNLNEGDWSAYMQRHLPLGVPLIDLQGSSTCQLVHQNFISGYSKTYKMPLWTAYKLEKQVTWMKHTLFENLQACIL